MGFVGGLGTCGDAHTQSLSFPKCCILPPSSSSSSSFPPRHLTCHVGHLLRRENMPKFGPPSWANFAIARMSPLPPPPLPPPMPISLPKLPPKTPQSWGEDNDGPPFVP